MTHSTPRRSDGRALPRTVSVTFTERQARYLLALVATQESSATVLGIEARLEMAIGRFDRRMAQEQSS